MNANYRGMNQFPEQYSGYGQSATNMQTMSYPQGNYDGANLAMMNPMNSSSYGMPGYSASHGHIMMSGQGSMPAHNNLYQSQQQQQQQQQAAYLAHQQQYYPGGSGGGSSSQYGGQQYPMQGGSSGNVQGISNSAYYSANAGAMGQVSPSSKIVPPPHHHLRNTTGQQNPQQVADNILQMASSYPSHHTVQIPLKNRHAPYQIPRSPHYGYAGDKGLGQQSMSGQSSANCQQSVSGQQQQQQGMGGQVGMGQPGAMMYLPSSPHNQPRTSPMSPLMMHSPASHQAQNLPSPGTMHSPNSASVRSPAPSPSMRSPCSMPMSGASMPMCSPGHLPSGFSAQQMNSSPHRTYSSSDVSSNTPQHQQQQHCSPTSMHSPVSHVSSPYTPGGMSAQISSPTQQSYLASSSSPYKMDMLMDSGQGPGGQQGQCQGSQPQQKQQSTNPLQSLQKLVMLPETQVVDPKSVVSDACLQGSDRSSSGEGSKNCEGPAGQSEEAVGCSAGDFTTSTPPGSHHTSSSNDNGSLHCGDVPRSCDKNGACADNSGNAPAQGHNSAPSVPQASGQSTSQLHRETVQPATSCADASASHRQMASPVKSVSPTSANSKPAPVSQNVSDSSTSVASRTQHQSIPPPSDSQSSLTKPSTNNVSVTSTLFGSSETSSKNTRRAKRAEVATPHKCNGVISPLETGRLAADTESSTSSVPSREEIESSVGVDSEAAKLDMNTVVKPVAEKRHSERLTNARNRNMASVSTQSQPSECSPESNSTAKPIVVVPKLINGFDTKHINGNASTEELLGHNFLHQNNHLQQNCIFRKNVPTSVSSVSFELSKKVTLSKIRSAHTQKSVAVSAESSCALVTVNGPIQAEIACSRRLDHGESDEADTDEEVEKVLEGHDTELSKLCSIFPPHVKSLGGGTDATFLDSGSDNEDFSFSDGFDLGYDSPPSEMTGEDSWKPPVGQTESVNGLDEADGIVECSEQDSDKGISPKSKGSAGTSNPSKVTSTPTRTVTRSSTGSIPKRKTEEESTTPVKRMRQSSGANVTNHVPLTHCGNSNLKEDAKVLNNGNSVKTGKDDKQEKDGKSVREKNLRESEKARNCLKSPVVVLTKSNAKAGKKKKKKDQWGKKPVNTVTRFLPRGKDGRFIRTTPQGSEEMPASKPASQIKEKTPLPAPAPQVKEKTCAPVHAARVKEEDTDEDEPLIAVQRRNSRGESISNVSTAATPTHKAEKSPIKTEPKLSPKTDVNGACDISITEVKPSTPCSKPEAAMTSCAMQSAAQDVIVSASPIKPTPDAPVSASSSVAGTPRKRGRPRKGEEMSLAKKKNKKSKSKTKRTEFGRQQSEDDSLTTMKLSKTLNLMQNKKKKGDNAQSAFSPFVRVEGKKDHPAAVSVFNHPPTENLDPKSAGKKKGVAGSAASVTMIQITNFSSDKTLMLPSAKTDNSSWVCALCGMRSSYRFLGDLFGPYYLESHLAAINRAEQGKDSKKGAAGTPGAESKMTRRKSTGSCHPSGGGDPVDTPQEVWVHEDCAMWSNGVYLVGSRIYGLEEALKAATATMCACCREKGAMVGCLHKGCNQTYHHMCAVDKDCYLDVENFSMLCPKHKDKRLKTSAAVSSKL